MKKILFLFTLFLTGINYAQTELLQNGTMDEYTTNTDDNADAWDITPNSSVVPNGGVPASITSPYRYNATTNPNGWYNSDLDTWVGLVPGNGTTEIPGSSSDGNFVDGIATRGLKFASLGRRLYQKVVVEAGETYIFSMESRSESAGTPSDVYMLNEEIVNEIGLDNAGDSRVDYYLNVKNDFNANKSTAIENNFTTNSFYFKASTNTIVIYVRSLYANSGTNEIFFDNFSLKKVLRWTGANGTDWTDTGNWAAGVVPTISESVVIPAGLTNYPIATTAVNTNGIFIESGASFIATSTVAGNVTYQVGVNDTNWHLLSSPVEGVAYTSNEHWTVNNEIDNTNRTVGTNIGLASYDNTTDLNGSWTYAVDGGAGTFNTGQGYSIKKDAITNPFLSFTGTIKTNNLTSTITQGFSNTNKWNLVGNPYTSYILVSDITTDNAANLTDTHENVYVWNGTAYTALLGTDYIHPGQGFFVNADNSNADNFTIDASKLSHQTATLYKTPSNPSIKLMITNNSTTKFTEINYLADKTTGLDPSYDVGTFTGASTNFNVFTHLVSNSNGVDFMKQSLPNSDFESMIIPVGLNADANKEITFSAESMNLPEGINVFLEDRTLNVFTNLNEGTYKVTSKEALNGVGRFYLHTSTKSVLSIGSQVALNNISIYKTNSSTLRIVGLQQGKANVKIYNVLGKQLMNSSFEANGVKEISLPNLAKGVYIVQLESEAGKLNKKIILE